MAHENEKTMENHNQEIRKLKNVGEEGIYTKMLRYLKEVYKRFEVEHISCNLL